MKIIKGIFDFICFIFRIVGVLILILVIILMSISVPSKIEYARYKETGIMKNGNLCISHICGGRGGYAEKYYNSDNSVLQEVEGFTAMDGIKFGISDSYGDVFGKVYKPINSGTSDIYVGYSMKGGDPIKYFELYHVEVDKDLNITYNMETIDKETFENIFTGD